MKHKHLYLKNAVFLLLFTALFSSVLTAQKKPTSVKLDVDADDMQMCAGQGIFESSTRGNQSQQQRQQQQNLSDNDRNDGFSTSQLCVLYRAYYYNLNSGNLEGAMYNRNDMIDLVVGQVDIYFKLRKDGRRTKIRIYEAILDFLRIGGDLAVAIMNGERAKSIIGASLGALDTGRSKFNKIFEVLETQVLVNKMIEKRTRILTEMAVLKDKPVRARRASDAYSWNEARNDLRRYLLAGTFDDALDTLVKESGDDVADAEDLLKAVTKRDVLNARCANNTLADLDAGLKNTNTAAETTTRLRAIVTDLLKDTNIAPLLKAKSINESSEGRAIWDALFQLRGDLMLQERADLVIIVNRAIGECRL